MKKIIFGIIGLFMSAMVMVSCSSNNSSNEDNVDEYCQETVDEPVDTMAVDSIVEVADVVLE